MSLVRRGLLSSRSLGRSAAPVTRRVANGEIIECGLDEAKISLHFVCHEQLSRPVLGHKHQIKGLFYEADLPEWDMIMGFDFLDIAHTGVLPHRRTLHVEEANKLSLLSTSMEPQASPWEPVERDVLAQAVRNVSTRSPQPTLRMSTGCLRVPFTCLGGSSCMVKNEGKGRKMTGFQRHRKIVVLLDIIKASQTSMAD